MSTAPLLFLLPLLPLSPRQPLSLLRPPTPPPPSPFPLSLLFSTTLHVSPSLLLSGVRGFNPRKVFQLDIAVHEFQRILRFSKSLLCGEFHHEKLRSCWLFLRKSTMFIDSMSWSRTNNSISNKAMFNTETTFNFRKHSSWLSSRALQHCQEVRESVDIWENSLCTTAERTFNAEYLLFSLSNYAFDHYNAR